MPVAYKPEKTSLPLAEDSSKYCLEANRLDSFDDRWPHADDSLCSRESMSKAGFFYNGYSDCVKCFVCHIKLNGWEPENDDPWTKHLEVSPNCLFAKLNREEGNLTVEQWCDVLCARAVNLLDSRLSKLLKDEQEVLTN